MSYILRITDDVLIHRGEIEKSPYIGAYVESFTCKKGIKLTDDPKKAKRFKTQQAASKLWVTDCKGAAIDHFDPTFPEEVPKRSRNQPLARFSCAILNVEHPEEDGWYHIRWDLHPNGRPHGETWGWDGLGHEVDHRGMGPRDHPQAMGSEA